MNRADPSHHIAASRSLLLFGLLALAGAAHAAGDPMHHSAGGSCPSGSTDAPVDEAADEARPGPTSQRADDTAAAPAVARSRSGGGGERARSRLRWHSFVPGMFK